MRYSLPVSWGAYVTGVVVNSPASEAGLRQGDIITRIGDVVIDENHSFINALFQYNPGDKVILEVARGEQKIQVEVILGETNSGR